MEHFLQSTIKEKACSAKKKSYSLCASSLQERNLFLEKLLILLKQKASFIIDENKKDLCCAKEQNLSTAMVKRLELSSSKIDTMIASIKQLILLPDPLGVVQIDRLLDNDLRLTRLSVPVGLIGVIFESRPDAFIQIATLAIKSGNCVILKGGKEATFSNNALFSLVQEASQQADKEIGKSIFEGTIVLAQNREEINALLSLDEVIDLMIPRGSNELVRYIKEHTKIPVLGHADGICHFYIDKEVNIDQAITLCVDGKTQYPAVCNALETILVHKDIAPLFLPLLKEAFSKDPMKVVEIRGDETCCSIIEANKAIDEDWSSEYGDLIVSIKVVNDIDEAITHINRYGSHHTDGIATTNIQSANYFMETVDSSTVTTNASTRFADGFRYGFGAEVGISTSKIHARGPVGLEGLTIYKYRLVGDGNIVSDYVLGKKNFLHKDLI